MHWEWVVIRHMEAAGWLFVGSQGLLRFRNGDRIVDVFKWSVGTEKHLVVREGGRNAELPYSNSRQLPLVELDAFISVGGRGE